MAVYEPRIANSHGAMGNRDLRGSDVTKHFITQARLISLSLVWLITASAEELQNPSFEKAGDTSEQAAGWHIWGSWLHRETGWVPVRTDRALLVYQHANIEKPEPSGISQDVAGAKAGRRYTFSIYANIDPA